MNDALWLVLLLVVAGAVMFLAPWLRLKVTIPKVVRLFRNRNATDARNAKTSEELGIKPPSALEGILTRRDYRRYALRALVQAQIVQTTEDGKMYLSEEKLSASKLGSRLGVR